MQRTLDTPEGWLIMFYRTPGLSWDEKIKWETHHRDGRTIHYVGA